ncbi:hypothetical protein J3F83DRAFT_106855 [Trichoderma novae-zelandiae]
MANQDDAAPECKKRPETPKPANGILTGPPGLAPQPAPLSPPPQATQPAPSSSSSPPADQELEIHSPTVSVLNSPSLPAVPAFSPAATAAALLSPPKSPARPRAAAQMPTGISKQRPRAVTLLKDLVPSALAPFVSRQRRLLYEMAKAGVITVHPDVILRVGINGSLEVDGTKDEHGSVKVGDKVFSKDKLPDGEPPRYIAGANIPQSLLDRNGRRLTHREFLEMKGDSIFYRWAVKTLSGLPEMTHERWWDAVEFLQKLPPNGRSQKVLVGPLYKAHIYDTMDRATVHNVGVKLQTYEYFTEEELNVGLPMAVGRLMGLSPPAVLSVRDVWADQFCAFAYEIDAVVADTATSLFSILKLMAKHPDADEHLRPLAVEKQELLESGFERIQELPGMVSLHKFVDNAVKAGWH